MVPEKSLTWFCLVCVPQRELLARDILVEMGLEACVPLEFKHMKRRGNRSVVKAYPLLGSRYVFVGSSSGFPYWIRYELHLIGGYVRSLTGEPAVFEEKTIKKLDRITKSPYNDIIGTAVRHKSLRVGEAVIIKTPPFEDHHAVVLEVKRGKVQVFISILGGAQAVWVDMDSVEHD